MRRLTALSCLVALTLTASARAQNRARVLSTLSPAALGQPVGVSIGISTFGLDMDGNGAIGDIALGRGALRLAASHPSRFETYGLGYAAPLATRGLTPTISTTFGGELSFGYYGTRFPKSDYIVGNGTSLNAHLTLPVSLRIGTSERLSFTSYVAPYVELGAAPSGYWMPVPCDMYSPCAKFIFADHYRTTAAGAALGMRLTIWRVGLEAAYGDVPRYAAHGQMMSLGLSLRAGH